MNLRTFAVFATLGLLSCSSASWAQYSTDRHVSWYRVVNFPTYFVENEADRTFIVTFSGEERVFNTFSPEELAERVKFGGWTQVHLRDNAYMSVNVHFNDLMIETIDVVDKSSTDKEGNVKPSFEPFFIYTFPAHVEFKNPVANNSFDVNRESFEGNKRIEYHINKEFPSRKAAVEYVKNNRPKFISEVVKTNVDNVLKRVNESGTSNYGYGATNARVEYYNLDSKKHPNYEEQVKDAETLKAIYANCTSGQPIDKSQVMPIIERYKQIIETLNDTERKQKRAKIHLMATIAEIYLTLDDLDKCAEWAQKLVDQYNEEDGEDLIDKVKKVKALMDKYKVTTRHFVAKAPEVNEELPENNVVDAPQQPVVVERVIEKVVEKEVKAKDPVCTVSVNGDMYEYEHYIDAFNEHARTEGSTASVYIKARKSYVNEENYSYGRINGGNVTFDLNGQSVYGRMVTLIQIYDGTLTMVGNGRISLGFENVIRCAGGQTTINMSAELEAPIPVALDNGAKMTIVEGNFKSTRRACLDAQNGSQVVLQGGRFDKAEAAEAAITFDAKSKVELAPGYEYVYFVPHDGVKSLREIKGNVLYSGEVRKIKE
ncbi:MAG: hypothetical protein K6G73_12700 [Marinilabiliaceae bacterium]|nr:hypothetical protein [Marinilabiliaceae bacterium]